MRSDLDIKRDVEAELRWNRDIDATDIAVAVKNGVVTLTGFVRRYTQKREAERTVKRIAGVAAVANDLDVRLPIFNQRPDPAIARDAVAAIQHNLPNSGDHIRVVVRDGWITLEGTVGWDYQRGRAKESVRHVRGLKGVTNLIQLSPRVRPTGVKRKIDDALRRSAEVDAGRISVETDGGTMILKGTVRSWVEREAAERTAWAAPGVTRVENQITVSL